MICANLAAEPAGVYRDRQIAWLRDLQPRCRGVILGDGCDRVPELRDLR